MGLLIWPYEGHASSYMSIDLWLEEVADQCKVSLDNGCSPLQPLVNEHDNVVIRATILIQ